jgi:hypothetical protein
VSGEGVQRAGAAAEPIFLWLVVILVAVLGVLAAAILLGAAGLLDLLERKAVGGRVRGGLTLPAVVDARGVQQAVRIKMLAWGRSSLGPRLSRREYFWSRCP